MKMETNKRSKKGNFDRFHYFFVNFSGKKIDFFLHRVYTVFKWSKMDKLWSEMEEVRLDDR